MRPPSPSGYKDTWTWNAGLSSYWFSSSLKWFVLLLIILPEIVKRLEPDQKNTAWGLTVSIGALWAMVGPSLFGDLSDRTGGRKRFLAIGALTTCVALAVVASAQSLAVLVFAYFLLQVADDIGTGPYGGVIPQLVPEDRRGFASSVMAQMNLLAQLAGGTSFLILRDPRLVLIFIGLVSLLGCAVTLYTLRNSPPPPRDPNPTPWFRGYFTPWKTRRFRVVWTCRLLGAIALYGVQNYLQFFIFETFQRDANGQFSFFGALSGPASAAVGVLALTVALGGACGAFISRHWPDRFGRVRVLRISAAAAVCALFPLAFVNQTEIALGIAFAFGLSYGMYMGAEWALASDAMPSTTSLGRDMGLWTSSTTFGQFLVGGYGPLIDHLNRQSPGSGYSFTIIAGCVLFACAGYLIKFAAPPSHA